jgi:hypothetical protein
LALILNGPARSLDKPDDRPFARKDGVSPLEVVLDVPDPLALTSVDWRIDAHSYEKNLGDAILSYSYPFLLRGRAFNRNRNRERLLERCAVTIAARRHGGAGMRAWL